MKPRFWQKIEMTLIVFFGCLITITSCIFWGLQIFSVFMENNITQFPLSLIGSVAAVILVHGWVFHRMTQALVK